MRTLIYKTMINEQTPLIDLAPKLFTTITAAQELLAKWIVPDSEISDSQVLIELLEILDDRELVSKMREIIPVNLIEEKKWPHSLNVESTAFDEQKAVMEIKMKDGSIYQYLDFTKECWDRLVLAESIGSFLHLYVRGIFRYQRVNVD